MSTLPAVRSVRETDDVHVIEGLAIPYGGPFNGKDTYDTFFSVRSNLALETPTKVWYNHGFDPDFGFSSIGRVTSYRTDDDGVWVEAELDKRHRYYETRVKPLLEKQGLGFSAGSAEHSYTLDQKSGEILTYPVHEVSLTPTEANPWAAVAARAADVITILAARKEPEPEPEPAPAAHSGEPEPDTTPEPAVEPVEPDDASRSADPETTVRIVEPEDADALRIDIDAIATRAAKEAIRALLR